MSNTIASNKVDDRIIRGKKLNQESKKAGGGLSDSDAEDQLQNRLELQEYLTKLTNSKVGNGVDALCSRILDDISSIDQSLTNPDQSDSSSSTTLPDSAEISGVEDEADKFIADSKKNSSENLSSQSKKDKKSSDGLAEQNSFLQSPISTAVKPSSLQTNSKMTTASQSNGQAGYLNAPTGDAATLVNNVWNSLLKNSGGNGSNTGNILHQIANNCDPGDTADAVQTEVGGLAGNDNQKDPAASVASGADQRNKSRMAIGKANAFSTKNRINVGIRSMMALQFMQKDPTSKIGAGNMRGGGICLPALKTMASLMEKSKKRSNSKKAGTTKDPVESEIIKSSASQGASKIEKKGDASSASEAQAHKTLGSKIAGISAQVQKVTQNCISEAAGIQSDIKSNNLAEADGLQQIATGAGKTNTGVHQVSAGNCGMSQGIGQINIGIPLALDPFTEPEGIALIANGIARIACGNGETNTGAQNLSTGNKNSIEAEKKIHEGVFANIKQAARQKANENTEKEIVDSTKQLDKDNSALAKGDNAKSPASPNDRRKLEIEALKMKKKKKKKHEENKNEKTNGVSTASKNDSNKITAASETKNADSDTKDDIDSKNSEKSDISAEKSSSPSGSFGSMTSGSVKSNISAPSLGSSLGSASSGSFGSMTSGKSMSAGR